MLGRDVETDSVDIRRLTGYLPGGIALYDSLSGEEALDYLGDLQGREPVRRAELCDRLELPPNVLKRRVRDYSRGMRQKIGVVQALQHDPELAILDEPTEGLDPLMQQAFYRILDDLRTEGRTVFFSSHVLSEVERLCDRVAIIRGGHLMAIHDVGDLLARRRRRVMIQWRGGSPDLPSLPGLEDVQIHGNRMLGTLTGKVAEFVRAIASPSLEDLTIEPASLEEAFLEYYADGDARTGRRSPGGEGVNGRLFRQTLRWQRTRLLVVLIAAIAWGILIPIVYSAFSDAMRDLVNSGAIPNELLNIGSGIALHVARRHHPRPPAPAGDRDARDLRGRRFVDRDRRRARPRHSRDGPRPPDLPHRALREHPCRASARRARGPVDAPWRDVRRVHRTRDRRRARRLRPCRW